jgi:hypothetical protein
MPSWAAIEVVGSAVARHLAEGVSRGHAVRRLAHDPQQFGFVVELIGDLPRGGRVMDRFKGEPGVTWRSC